MRSWPGAFLALLLPALPARALDPRFEWQTLETPHFEVHFHQGTYRYAQRVARAAELMGAAGACAAAAGVAAASAPIKAKAASLT